MSAGSVEPKNNYRFLPRSHKIFAELKAMSKTRTGVPKNIKNKLTPFVLTQFFTFEQITYQKFKELGELLKKSPDAFFYPDGSTPDDADQAIKVLRENRSRRDAKAKALADKSKARFSADPAAAELEIYLKNNIKPPYHLDTYLHIPVVYELLEISTMWTDRKSNLLNDCGELTPEHQTDLKTFIQHIDNAIEAAKKPPDLKPAVDTNKAGTTITDPEAVTNPQKIIQAAYQYVQTQGDSAKDALKKLLKGVFKDPEIKSNQLVDLILKHPDAPHEPLNVIQKNVLAKNRSGEKFSPAERETIIRFCDFATCIALPKHELAEIQRQIEKKRALIQVGTQDRPLIILHFARLLPTSDYQSELRQDQPRILDQIRDRQLIPKNLQEISVPAEAGAGKGAVPSYIDLFIGGMALQLGIPGFDINSAPQIENTKKSVKADLKLLQDSAIRIVVFVDENRDREIEELNKMFPEIFFIGLPKEFTTDSYRQIITLRKTIYYTA